MNNRMSAPVLLLAIFTLQMFAQENAPNSSDQSVPPIQASERREPLTAPEATNFWDGDDPNFLNLITHPFANRKYVQRYTAPIKDRLNELDEMRTEDENKAKDIDARSQNGLSLASEKVSTAEQHASDASSRAQGAQSDSMEASNHVARVEHVVANIDQYKATAQTEIDFRPGQAVLNRAAKDALDQLAAPLENQKNYMIEVRGFSAGKGSAAIANSQRLAGSVTRYLALSHRIPVYRIHAISMGNATVAQTKNITRSRVEVSVLRNEAVTVGQR